jgi:hypothetical protein
MLICLRKLWCVVIGTTLLVNVSGCIMNPHVSWKREDAKVTPSPSTLAEGLKYAELGIDAYKAKMSEQTQFKNYLALFLIPLSAAALAMGIDGANATAIAALGLTGAATFGVGNFLTSQPRQLVYGAGANAINCAKAAVLPLDFSNRDFADFTQQLTHLQNAMDNMRKKEPMDADDKALLDKAEEVLPQAQQLDIEIVGATGALISAIDKIVIQVDIAIESTTADLQSVSTIIGGLAQTSSRFTTIQDPLKAASPSGQNLTAMVDDPKEDLRKSIHEVNRYIRRVASANPLKALKECGVATIDTSFKIQPPGQITLYKAQPQLLIVEGGKAPYTADLIDRAKGIVVTKPIAFGNQILIEATEDLPAGSKYRLYIADSASPTHSMIVDLVSGTTPAGAASQNSNVKKGTRDADASKELQDFLELKRAALGTTLQEKILQPITVDVYKDPPSIEIAFAVKPGKALGKDEQKIEGYKVWIEKIFSEGDKKIDIKKIDIKIVEVSDLGVKLLLTPSQAK